MRGMMLALIIAVVGVFAVSSIAATHLLKNSHVFKETTMNSSFCEKCHTEQVEGMALGGGHFNSQLSQCEFCHTGDGEIHGSFKIQCEDCHHDGSGGGISASYSHNGILNVDSSPDCLSCHSGGGFRPDMEQLKELASNDSAHSGMLEQNTPTVACISCHTTHESGLDDNYNEGTSWVMD